MSAVAAWVVEALVASAVLMLAVLALRRPVRRAFGPDVGYALWALPALRLLLPPLPASWHAATVAPVLRATGQVTVLFVQPTAAPVVAAPDLWAQALPYLVPLLAMLWLVGAGGFALWHVFAHHRFCARTLAQAVAGDTIGGVRVIESAAVSGPLAFGVWRRYVAFPRDAAARYDAEERDLALAHELGHHARGDLIANWLALAVLALHWFNPVAWRAFRAFRADQEIANDARVLAALGPLRRHAYACAIVKTACPATSVAVSTACHLNTVDDLKGRLRMLSIDRVSRLRRFAGSAAVTLLVGGGLGLTASGTAAVAAARDTVEQASGVELATLAQATVAPAPPVAVPPVDPPPPANRKSKHRYKLVVTEDGRTVSEHDLSVPATPGTPGTQVRRLLIRDRDGKVVTDDFGPGVPPPPATPGRPRVLIHRPDGASNGIGPGTLPPTPIIENMHCDEGGNGKPVIHDRKDGKRRVILCTDRIERMVAHGAAMAANGKDIERRAYLGALGSLRMARARMVDAPGMSGDERKAGLDGIDQAIRELEADVARTK